MVRTVVRQNGYVYEFIVHVYTNDSLIAGAWFLVEENIV